MYVIPRKTKVKLEFIKGVTGLDLVLGIFCVVVAVLLIFANFFNSFAIKFAVVLSWIILSIAMFLKVADDRRFYVTITYLLKFMVQKKRFTMGGENDKGNIQEIVPYERITEEQFIDFGVYYAGVLEIKPILFGLLNEYNQNSVISSFSNALMRLTQTQTCSVIKLNKAMVFDNYIHNENSKYDLLYDLLYEKQMTQTEIDARAPIFEERVSDLLEKNSVNKIYKDYFYIVVYDKDKEAINTTLEGMINSLATCISPITSTRLKNQELAIFLKAYNSKEFDERDVELVPYGDYAKWARPEKVTFKTARYLTNDKAYRTFVITDYPLQVGNAWGASFFLLDRTKVHMKFKPMDKLDSEKQIDKAIMEMEAKYSKVGRSSKKIEIQTHIETLKDLLANLKNNNQQLFEVNTFVIAEDAAKKDVRAMLKQAGFKYSEMFSRQVDAYISSNISMKDNIKDTKRGIPTTTLAAVFPFISSALQDENGFYIGDNEYPVYVDFFKRDRERVNSNMMVIGKSGSGKSYATKTLLTNFAADNSKIFILDPENEYKKLTETLGGKFIDVGSSMHGIINPFHVMTNLEGDDLDVVKSDEESDEEQVKKPKKVIVGDTFSQHLQFLEQFFRTILEGINTDAFELLNSLVLDTYKKKNIDFSTDLSKLGPADFPIFDDFYEVIQENIKTAKDEFTLKNLMTIEVYIKKFTTGGRNSNIWNGPTSIETNENFVTFNFQSLVASNNPTMISAQMLLVFKYLNNEIINNKDFNEKFHLKRKIIVCVDEAHMFINPKYPVALDFMQQMAKRIRKYGGMEIVITQNIADFVGSEEIRRQSTAIINACQYSLIFSLAPNDINDLVELYKKSGGINEEEQNSIVTAGVGQTFIITGATSRTTVNIVALEYVKDLITT